MEQLLSLSTARSSLFLTWIVLLLFAFWNQDYIVYTGGFAAMLTLIFYVAYNYELKVRLIDIGVAIFLLGELFNLMFSTYPPNSLNYLFKLCFVTLVYMSFSLLSDDEVDNKLKYYLTIYGGIIGVMSFVAYLLFRSSIIAEGFYDFENLKHLYLPLGEITNDWSTILLFFFSFTIYSFINTESNWKRTWIISGGMFLLFSIIVTYSRGIYLATISLIVISFYSLLVSRSIGVKKLFVKFTYILLGTICLSMLVFEPLSKTLEFDNSVSQQRSIDGRMSIWKNSRKMISERPVNGIGSGNFPLLYSAYTNDPLTSPYTTRVNNTLVQVLVEKGIVGLVTFGFLVTVLGFALAACLLNDRYNARKVFACIMAGFLVALLIKELTFSSLFENTKLLLLFFFVCFFLRSASKKILIFKLESKLSKLLIVVSLIIPLLWIAFKSYQDQIAKSLSTKAIIAFEEGNMNNAKGFLNQAIDMEDQQAIYFINRAVIQSIQNSTFSTNESIDSLNSGLLLDYAPKYTLNERNAIIADYFTAMNLNPYDSRAHYNIAWIYLGADSIQQGIAYLKRAIELEPDEETYWLSLALALDYGNLKKSADSCYEKAVILSPNVINSIFWKKFSKNEQIRSDNILLKVRDKLLMFSDNDVMYRAKYAALLIKEGSGKSLKILEEVNKSLPNLNRAWVNLGIEYTKHGMANKAMVCLRRSILLKNRDPLPYFVLARYFDYIKNFNEAVDYYTKVLLLQVNARSTYDERVGRTYGIRSTLPTSIPQSLWKDVNFQVPLSIICLRLHQLHRELGNEVLSNQYLKMSQKEFLVNSDLNF